MRKSKSKRRKFSWGGSNKNMRGYIQQPQSTVRPAFMQMSPMEALNQNTLNWNSAEAHVNNLPIYPMMQGLTALGLQFGGQMADNATTKVGKGKVESIEKTARHVGCYQK
jgi:hypothetical protein